MFNKKKQKTQKKKQTNKHQTDQYSTALDINPRNWSAIEILYKYLHKHFNYLVLCKERLDI